MSSVRIAVLMTCYNRRETTLGCLRALYQQEGIHDLQMQIYLVDDGCTDGTGKAVRTHYPDAKVLHGNGNLFWNGGMSLAFAEALQGNYDYYLWINDDTMLFTGAVRTLLRTFHALRKQEGREEIVTGSTRDPKNGRPTYGGVSLRGFLRKPVFVLMEPLTNKACPCDTVNGNCVLIPRQVAQRIGNLSPGFSHGLGDFDYGLRAKKLGISCWIAPGYIGTCAAHDLRCSYYDRTLPIGERLRKMRSPTGLPPAREWMCFTRRHGGWLWPICWLRTILRVCLPQLWLLLRGKPVN